MQMQILSVFLGRIHSQSYFLKKTFFVSGNGLCFEMTDFSGCDCISVSIQIRNVLSRSVTKLFLLSMLWLVLQSKFRSA